MTLVHRIPRTGRASTDLTGRQDAAVTKTFKRWIFALGLLACAAPRAATAQGVSESTGVAQYFTNCAKCHESAETHTAPRTAVLKQMTPEHIYEVLSTGSMRTAAANLTDPEKRLIAEWVG